jgi:hypothetical protein
MCFGSFEEVALFVFFVDFAIFFTIPFLTKFVFRSNIRNLGNYLQNDNAYAKECN